MRKGTRDSGSVAHRLRNSFSNVVVVRKSHTYAVHDRTGRGEDPGRTRSAGYQLVCIACVSVPKRASVRPWTYSQSSYSLSAVDQFFLSEQAEERWMGRWRRSCSWRWTCCAFLLVSCGHKPPSASGVTCAVTAASLRALEQGELCMNCLSARENDRSISPPFKDRSIFILSLKSRRSSWISVQQCILSLCADSWAERWHWPALCRKTGGNVVILLTGLLHAPVYSPQSLAVFSSVSGSWMFVYGNVICICVHHLVIFFAACCLLLPAESIPISLTLCIHQHITSVCVPQTFVLHFTSVGDNFSSPQFCYPEPIITVLVFQTMDK